MDPTEYCVVVGQRDRSYGTDYYTRIIGTAGFFFYIFYNLSITFYFTLEIKKKKTLAEL